MEDDKRLIVITGTGSDLGAALCEDLYGNESIHVIGIGRNFCETTNYYTHLQGDLTDKDIVERLKEIIISTNHSLFGLVNIAGVSLGESIEAMDIDDWNKMMEINLNVPMKLCKIAAKYMVDGGRIINVGSPVGWTGANKPGYAASKAGLHGLTMAVAKNLGPRKILVNTILPGPMVTGMTRKWSQERRDKVATESFLGRLTNPEDVAKGIIFLLDESTQGITGSILDFTAGSMFTH